MKKTSKEKQRLEEFINKLRDEFTVQDEYKFHPDRRWRFDWAICRPGNRFKVDSGTLYLKANPPYIAVEYEGGVFIGGGHTRGVLYGSNCEKYNEAAIMGWTVLRFTAPMIRQGLHETQINKALGIS